MKYRQFVSWCNDRATDGYWDFRTAEFCCHLISKLNKHNFIMRNKLWKSHYEWYVSHYVVRPINLKIVNLKSNKEI